MATSASVAADRAKAVSPGTQTGRDVLDSPEFHQLISRRWRISLVLTAALFVVYYGFILLVATNKPLLSRPLGSATLGIVVGVAVILLSWGLTAVYVVWANRHYDPAVKQLLARLR